MELGKELEPCPFCAWDADQKAQIRMTLAVSGCPCTHRNSFGEEKYLEAVVYHFREKLEKILIPKKCDKPCPPDWAYFGRCVREREHENETHVLEDGRVWPLDGYNQKYA